MKYLLIFFCSIALSQSDSLIAVKLIDKTTEFKEGLIYKDAFNSEYFLISNSLQKKTDDHIVYYNNVQLGDVESVNLFNPLKINLFYKDFNTVIILDNRLAEIFKIDFNSSTNYKNISHVSTGSDNTLWLFNLDTQQLELFDYKLNKVRLNTVPIQGEVLDLKSDYNYCWLLTKDFIYEFNYFGSLMNKIKNEGFTELEPSKGNLILKRKSELFFIRNGTSVATKIDLPKLLINAFFVNRETLYIYDTNSLYKYQLKTN